MLFGGESGKRVITAADSETEIKWGGERHGGAADRAVILRHKCHYQTQRRPEIQSVINSQPPPATNFFLLSIDHPGVGPSDYGY